MKLLIVTQKVDENDGVLGFFHGWIKEFADHFDHLEIICLQKGEVNLPSYVLLHSLGKEKGYSLLHYIFRFYYFLWQARKRYDAVFVHMNQEYVLLGGFLWKLWGKKIIFWYNHTNGTWKTKLAMKFADVVLHTSPYAFTAGTEKSKRMPAGIDENTFKKVAEKSQNPLILFVGRITPIKDLGTFIEALNILDKRNVRFSAEIYGETLAKDATYENKIKEEAKELREKGLVMFNGKIPNKDTPPLFSRAWVFVNLTPKGNYDKTVLEAMACESLPVVSSEAFSDILAIDQIFREKDSTDLANKIEKLLRLGPEKRQELGKEMRQKLIATNSLRSLAEKISQFYK